MRRIVDLGNSPASDRMGNAGLSNVSVFLYLHVFFELYTTVTTHLGHWTYRNLGRWII